jgi:hypothetical protein
MTKSVARIKAEFQEKGVRVPPDLIAELESKYNAPAISTGRMVLCLESPTGNDELIPVFIVNGKRGAYSPYHLVKKREGHFEVWEDGSKYTEVVLIVRPAFYDKLTGGNIPMHKIAVIVGPGHLRSVVDQSAYISKSDKRVSSVLFSTGGMQFQLNSQLRLPKP